MSDQLIELAYVMGKTRTDGAETVERVEHTAHAFEGSTTWLEQSAKAELGLAFLLGLTRVLRGAGTVLGLLRTALSTTNPETPPMGSERSACGQSSLNASPRGFGTRAA